MNAFYQEGYEACLSNNSLPANPYKFYTYSHSEWQRGLRAALDEWSDSFYADQGVRWSVDNV